MQMKQIIKYGLVAVLIGAGMCASHAQNSYAVNNFSFESWSTAPGDTISILGGVLTLPLYNAYEYPTAWNYMKYHVNKSTSIYGQPISVNTNMPLFKASYETGMVPHGNRALKLQTFKLSDIVPSTTYSLLGSYVDSIYTATIFPSCISTASTSASDFLDLYAILTDTMYHDSVQILAAVSQLSMDSLFTGGMPLNGFEPSRLHGYYKYTSAVAGDNAGVLLIGTRYNSVTHKREMTGGGYSACFTDINTYVPFNVQYMPMSAVVPQATNGEADSLIIMIISSACANRQQGSVLYMDSLILYHDIITRPDTCREVQNVRMLHTDSMSAVVAWSNDTSVMYWEVEYGEEGYVAGSSPCSIVTDTAVTLNNLYPFTSYDVYVRACCNDTLYSGWNMLTFTTLRLADRCEGAHNVQVVHVAGDTAVIAWQADYSPLYWQVICEEVKSGTMVKYMADTLVYTTDTMAVFTGLHYATPYKVTVQAQCNDTLYSVKSVLEFVSATDVNTVEAVCGHIGVSPNPAHGQLYIQCEELPYEVSVYTYDGKCVYSKEYYTLNNTIYLNYKGLLVIKITTPYQRKVCRVRSR